MKEIYFRRTCIATSLALMLSACGGGSSDNGAATGTTGSAGSSQAAGNMTISGAVVSGPTGNATVSVFAADGKGLPSGTALGIVQTDASGKYTVNFNGTPNSAFIIVASGGSYASEADASTQTGAKLSALLDAVPAGSTTAVITPLSHAEAVNAQTSLAAGKVSTVAGALTAAHAKINALLGVPEIVAAAANVMPDFAATSGAGYTMAAMLGFLEQLRKNLGLTATDFYQAFADDIADGTLDGLKNGAPVIVQSTGKTFLPSSLTAQLTGAVNDFVAANPKYATQGVEVAHTGQVNASTGGLLVGSSGAITVVDNSVYFAARTDGLVRLDMSDPSTPVATTLKTINQAALPVLTSIDGIVVSPVPINAITYGIAYSYGSSSVVLLDLTNNKMVSTIPLKISNSVSFSGANASIAGGIFDGANHIAWLATGDGLVGIDLTNPSAAPVLIAQPAGTTINENLGGDPAHGLIISPDYLNKTLVVFNLNERKAYTTPTADWQKVMAAVSSYTEVDGVAVDSNYRLALLTPEDGGKVVLVNYNEKQTAGATTPVGSYSPSLYKTFSTGTSYYGQYSGSAVDSLSHYALLVGEGSNIGVGVLDDPSSPNWAGFKQFVNVGPTSFSFEPHDPHAVAVFNLKGKPYGFLMSGSYSGYTLLSMDLQGIINSPAANGVLQNDPVQGSFVKQTKYSQ